MTTTTTTYADVTRQIGDQWVDALTRTTDTAATFAEGAQNATADFAKAVPSQIAMPEQVTKLNEALAAQLPDPAEIIQANFELAERLMTAQRDLAIRLVEISAKKAS